MKVFKVEPFQIALDSLKRDEHKRSLEYEVTLKNVSPDPIELSLVSAPTELIRVQMPDGTLKPGKEKTIKIKFDREIADETFTKSFTIEASDSAKTRITVPITKNQRDLKPAPPPIKTK